MIFAIPEEDILKLLKKQLNNLFLLGEEEALCLDKVYDNVLKRCEYCFLRNTNKYYSRDGIAFFNPYHSGQYCIFLYFFSNEIWKNGNASLADRIYYLNKSLNCCDLFYEVELPSFFMLDHPVGTVMGRGKYSEGLSFGQNNTIGNNNGIYPVLGKNLRMCAASSVIGECQIGDNVTLGMGAIVKDQNIPSDSLVFGCSPNLIIKKKR